MEEQANVESQTAENQADTEKEDESGKTKRRYSVGGFDGPLDLLWPLIRDNKINISDIPIAKIPEQFQRLWIKQ